LYEQEGWWTIICILYRKYEYEQSSEHNLLKTCNIQTSSFRHRYETYSGYIIIRSQWPWVWT